MPDRAAGSLLAGLPLVDAHCHLLLADPIDAPSFERCLTEANRSGQEGMSMWDTPVGLATRRWCAPVLDLEPLAAPSAYLERRAELGIPAVTERLLRAAALSHLLVDTGLDTPELAGMEFLAEAAGARAHQVVRLERVAEELSQSGVTAGDFAAQYVDRLATHAISARALKSIAAYRHGLDLDPARPSAHEVAVAAAEWLAAQPARFDHPVLLRFVLWSAIDVGLPLQIHTGFGDRDLRLSSSDPALLQPWLAAVEPAGVAVILLHCYPYQRSAGWLATVYPHVYVDVGLTVGQVGAQAGAVLGEFFELAPFAKLLFSSDGYRLPELYLVGAAQFRHSFGRLLDEWVADGATSADDASRIARMVAADNARRVYLTEPASSPAAK